MQIFGQKNEKKISGQKNELRDCPYLQGRTEMG
jgi:hypothetical protein